MLADELRRPSKTAFQDVLRGHDVLAVACGMGYWTEVIAESGALGASGATIATAAQPSRQIASLEGWSL